jgi:hypothetical protein
VIVAEVERLRWRIWNGKAKNARRTLERVRKAMHVFQGERGPRTMAVPSSRNLGHALRYQEPSSRPAWRRRIAAQPRPEPPQRARADDRPMCLVPPAGLRVARDSRSAQPMSLTFWGTSGDADRLRVQGGERRGPRRQPS